MKNIALSVLFALSLAPAAALAQVVVREAPPAPIEERHDHGRHEGRVWTDGYYRWNGHGYKWVKGRWVTPPRPDARWVPYHWEQRGNGWVLDEGHWDEGQWNNGHRDEGRRDEDHRDNR